MSVEDVPLANSTLEGEDLIRARASNHTLTVVPLRRLEDGTAVYAEQTLFLVKELRADGVDIAFLDPSGQRSFSAQKSATVVLVGLAVAIGTGIASSAVWDGLKALVRRLRKIDPSPAAMHAASSGEDKVPHTIKVEITIIDLRKQMIGTQYFVEGSVDDALRAIESLERSDQLDAPEEQAESDANGHAV